MQGYGEHQQNAAPPVGRYALRLFRRKSQMQVGEYFIGKPEKKSAGKKTDHCGDPGRPSVIFHHFNGRCEKRPEARGDHHSRGKSEHSVEHFTVDRLEEKNECGSECCNTPGEERRTERLQNRMKAGKPGEHNSPLSESDSMMSM